jgi:hypothetical protein
MEDKFRIVCAFPCTALDPVKSKQKKRREMEFLY